MKNMGENAIMATFIISQWTIILYRIALTKKTWKWIALTELMPMFFTENDKKNGSNVGFLSKKTIGIFLFETWGFFPSFSVFFPPFFRANLAPAAGQPAPWGGGAPPYLPPRPLGHPTRDGLLCPLPAGHSN